MWAGTLHEHGLAPLQWGAVLGATLAACAFDLRTRRIPNALTGLLLLGGLAHAAVVAGTAGVLDAGAACLLLATPWVVLFAVAHGGAGDAKLMGAIGAWLGLWPGVLALAGVSLSGVALALAWAAARRRLPEVRDRLAVLVLGVMHLPFRRVTPQSVLSALPSGHEGLTMPYAPAILAGCLLAFGADLAWLD